MLRQGQPDGGKCCIVLESGPTRSLVAKLAEHFSLAELEFRVTKNATNEDVDRCVQNFDAGCCST